MTDPVQLAPRRGREGNRWVNQRPAPEEVAEWFQNSVKLHDGMSHEDWLSGITLIEAMEKHNEVVGFGDDGRPQIIPDVQHQFYIPFPKAETRVAYFNRWMENHAEWTGFILPVPAADPMGMPAGFYAMKVALPEAKGGVASMICYTARVLVIEGHVEWADRVDDDGVTRTYPTGKVVLSASPGTKSVPLLNRYGDLDPNAVMKAQTGAIGRALGYAGVLVIPGTGVATAEDMQESMNQGSTPGASATPDASSGPEEGAVVETSDALLRKRVAEMYAALQARPEEFATFQAWAKERKLGKLNEIEGAALKGLARKLQKMLDAAEPEEQTDGLDISGNDEPPTPVEGAKAEGGAL